MNRKLDGVSVNLDKAKQSTIEMKQSVEQSIVEMKQSVGQSIVETEQNLGQNLLLRF